MANRLKMAEHNAILGLARLGWSFRRIARELGVDRETVARHVRAARGDPLDSNAAISITGSDVPITGSDVPITGFDVPITGSDVPITGFDVPITGSDVPITGFDVPITGSDASATGSNASAEGAPGPMAAADQPDVPAGAEPLDPNAAIMIPGSAGQRSRCEPFRTIIVAQLELGLTAQRIWQDLKAEHDFDASYQSVQRFVKKLRATTPLPFRRMECGPGDEAQIDFGRGAPIVTPDGKRRRPHLLRVVLSCSRKAYSEAVPRQTTEHFIRALENAFWHFGGVPKTLVTDNLKAAVIQADWYDPDLNPKIQEFCRHYGTTLVPTRPRLPRHKGKVERGVGYAQSNALKGRTFDSLAAQNRFLEEWETSVADTRIHGTTRQQVGKLFTEAEQPALSPLPTARFPFFREGERIVNRDGHVEVAKAYYSAPPEFVGRTVWVRWDGHVVRIFDRQLRQIAIHAQHEPGRFATAPQHIAPQKRSGIERGTTWWLRKAHAIGGETGRWAESILQQRGIHGIRVVMGLVSLAQRHRDAEIEQACRVARSYAAWRLRDVRNLLKRQTPPQEQFEFLSEHPLIRSLADYGRFVHHAFEEVHS